MTTHGRDEADWERLSDAGRMFLIERARLRKVTSYTELNTTLERRTGLCAFDFAHADERAAMGHLLDLVVRRDFPATGLMLSVLVHYLDANDAGPGFYKLAADLRLLDRRASVRAKEEFWIAHLNEVHAYYSRTPA
jgi:hypothetical protein